MSCWHGSHGCGPWYPGPPGSGWYGPADWYEEGDWPIRRRSRRVPTPDADATIDELEARLAAMRDQVDRLEHELGRLRASGGPPAEER
jgi:hypothetical protein